MSKTITIRNNTSRPITLNLPAAIVPEASVRGRPVNAARGKGALPKKIAPIASLVSGSVTLLAKGTKRITKTKLPDGSLLELAGDVVKDLPFSARRAPDVIAAEARRDITVSVVVDKDAQAERPHAKPGNTPKLAAKPVVKEG